MCGRNWQRNRSIIAAWMLVAAFLLFWPSLPAAALTLLTVSNTNDSGAGSLRNAITQANAASGIVAIDFTVASGSTIAPLSALPTITHGQTYLLADGKVTLSGAGLSGSENGISVQANACIIQGLTIVSFPGNGISITGDDNAVYNCRIGTDGVNGLGNGANGVYIKGDDNLVGGVYSLFTWTDRNGQNIISGNGLSGVLYDLSSGGKVFGNLIGTDATGMTAIPNAQYGVFAGNSSNVCIGEYTAAERNIISGNNGSGITAMASSIIVYNNYIGTDITGAVALGNSLDGIQISAGSNGCKVGLARPFEGNVISGNGRHGILIVASSNGIIQANNIGTDAAGGLAIPNGANGINITASENTAIGRMNVYDGSNIISGNTQHGVYFASNATTAGTSLVFNRIGVGMDSATALGNGGDGIRIEPGNAGIMIGGVATPEIGNTIANNTYGVNIAAGASAITAQRNSIWNHAVKGITLAPGANADIAEPVISGIDPITGVAPADSAVEVYADTDGEGRYFLGAVTADAAGAFQLDVDLSAHAGRNVTALATDAAGNTSEFSAPFPIPGGAALHSADQNADNRVSLSELLRVVQFYNSVGYHCAIPPDSSEDGYVAGANPAQQSCAPHASDYNPQNWIISLSELLRLVQFYNSGGYYACPGEASEDGFCAGLPPGR